MAQVVPHRDGGWDGKNSVMAADVVDILERDHTEIRTLFEDVRRPDSDHRTVMRDIIQRSAAHVAVERNVLYPAIKHRLGDDEQLTDRLLADFHDVERLLVLIERRKTNSPDMPGLVTKLMDVMDAHAQAADASLFPAIRSRLDTGEREHLGEQVSFDESVVLSHPHPHLLSLGPLNRLLLPLAAAFDRLRDRMVSNR